MSLRIKIWLSIFGLVLLFTMNSVVIFMEMEENKTKSEELAHKIEPSLNFLYDLRRNITERASLTSEWIFNSSSELSKQKLKSIRSQSKNVFFEIRQIAENYKETPLLDSLKNLSHAYTNLTALEGQIINTLVSFDDYSNPEKRWATEAILENELSPLSHQLAGSIDSYIRYTLVWRNVKDKSIALSAQLIKQLSILLITELILLGFILSFLVERMLIKPIIEVKDMLLKLKNGIIIKKQVKRSDEIGAIQKAVNALADRVDEMSDFALEVGQRNFDMHFSPLSEHDKLGKSLVSMCQDLKKNILRLEETKKIAGIGYLEYNPATGQIEFSEIIKNILDIDEIPNPGLTDFLKVFSNDDVMTLQVQIRDCLKYDSKIEQVFPIVSYKNKPKIISISGQHFITADDMVGKIVLVIQDITERKRAENELKNAHNQMEMFFKNIDDVFFSFDCNNKQLIQVSDACEKIYGYAKEDFRKNINLMEEAVAAEDAPLFEQKKTEMKNGKAVIFEYRIKTKSGKIKWVETKMIPTCDKKGNITRVDGITADISNRKENEEVLNTINNDLRKSNSELDKFVYSVSHDLRAPLTSMQGIVELTELETTEEITGKHMKMLNNSIRKLDNFIGDILNYSRNSRLDIKREPVNFNELVNDVARELQYMNGPSNAMDIHIDVKAQGVFYSDTNRIRMALSNLVSNSIRYFDVNKKKPFVNIYVKANEHSARIDVEDNGIGIAKELHEKVFDMFYRVSEQSVGSGLGLYIVKETVEKLKGNISLESVPGEGTKFHIQIPNLFFQ
ncbi:MAG: ATP-binding protein [Bacteroidia bacterium]